MKKWLKKLWREVREWLEEATGWNALDLGDFELSGIAGQGSDCNPPDLPGAPAVPGNPSSPADASGAVPEGSSSSAPVGDSAGEGPSPDDTDFAGLSWCWGGFKGGKASLADCRIKSLKVTRSGLSYSWASGGCEDLDSECSHSKPCCTCALFCRVGSKWLGGKFDHTSTDRRSRDFRNINEGYGGWEPEALAKATAFAFVILDDGAKRRTNVIVQIGGV